jgi:hypothetical protein
VASAAEVRALTETYRRLQARRAAAIAALVAYYYRSKVKVEDPQSIARWLDIMIPKVLDEHDFLADRAAVYGNKLRRLEMPGPQGYEFTPRVGAVAEQIERSLRYLGPESNLAKVKKIRELDLPPLSKQVLIQEAREMSTRKVGGAVARHVQNGGRQTLYDNILEDPVALGYIRVTKQDPCYFCAMLASRGIVYGEDSFDLADPRFTGSGNAKVHDSCACSLKPVYDSQDPMLVDVANFEALWYQSDGTALGFRRMYEGRVPADA